MTSLRESLVLTDARAISLLRQITKDGNTFVLVVKGPMTTELADTLRCRNQCYTLNDNPCPSLGLLKLDHEIINCELSVPTQSNLKPTMVTGFAIKPSEAADAEGTLEVSFRMKFSTGTKELNALLNAVKDNPFDMALMALQGGLFDQPAADAKGDGPEGGTGVDMTGDGADKDADDKDADEYEEESATAGGAIVDAEFAEVPEAAQPTTRKRTAKAAGGA